MRTWQWIQTQFQACSKFVIHIFVTVSCETKLRADWDVEDTQTYEWSPSTNVSKKGVSKTFTNKEKKLENIRIMSCAVLGLVKSSAERICVCTWLMYPTIERGNLEIQSFMTGRKLNFYCTSILLKIQLRTRS